MSACALVFVLGVLWGPGALPPLEHPAAGVGPGECWSGVEPAARFGRAVAWVGDLDGDGAEDLVVGAPFATGDVRHGGRVSAFGGGTGALLWSVGGAAAWSWFGQAVAAAGDVDADGVPDVAVGAPQADGARGWLELRSGVDGALLRRHVGPEPGAQLGRSVAGVGDADGDGVPDVAGGAPSCDGPGLLAGCAHLWSGAGGTPLHSWHGAPGDRFGLALAGLPDVDGDGRPELAVGAPLADGAAPQGGALHVLSAHTGASLQVVHGDEAGQLLGHAVAHVGDVDGDGRPDVAAGSPGHDLAATDAGSVAVHDAASGDLHLLVTGRAAGEGLFVVAGAGDVDGDGRDDLALGVPSAGVEQAGCLRLVSGDGRELLDWPGRVPAGWWGAAVDGRPCGGLVVGAPGHDDEPSLAGRACVLRLRGTAAGGGGVPQR